MCTKIKCVLYTSNMQQYTSSTHIQYTYVYYTYIYICVLPVCTSNIHMCTKCVYYTLATCSNTHLLHTFTLLHVAALYSTYTYIYTHTYSYSQHNNTHIKPPNATPPLPPPSPLPHLSLLNARKVEILSGRYLTHGPPKGFDFFTSEFLPGRWVMSHIRMSHVPRMNESRPTNKWITSHV